MMWEVEYLPDALKDIKSLDGSQRVLVRKAIEKVKQNPLPESEGGYGKPLGNKNGIDLTNCLKVKLRGSGIRIVYKLRKTERGMVIIVVGAREDAEVYQRAEKRLKKEKLK